MSYFNAALRPTLRPPVFLRLALHLTVDNYVTHKHPVVVACLKTHPRMHMHFTPTSSSWMNLVERFFRQLADDVFRDGSFARVSELITAQLAHHNLTPCLIAGTPMAPPILITSAVPASLSAK